MEPGAFVPVKSKPEGETPRRHLIYLDQCIVSAMAKFRLGELAPGPRRDSIERLWTMLVEGVRGSEELICVESLLHRQESSPLADRPERVPFFQEVSRVVQLMCMGLYLLDPESMRRFQTLFALSRTDTDRFLQLSDSVLWHTGISRDPDEPNSQHLIQIGGTSFSLGVEWQREQRRKNDWAQFMETLRSNGEFTGYDAIQRRWFEDLRKVALLCCQQRNWGASWRYRRRGFVDTEEVIRFIQSDGFSSVPLPFLLSRIHATVAAEPSRTFSNSDRYDAWILAQAIPYCDAVVTDSYMAEKLRQLRLPDHFATKVFGGRNHDLTAAAEHLHLLVTERQ